jgi:hypothetical protein
MAAKKTKRTKTVRHVVSLVSGVEGLSIYLNNYRIAGPKPWGGGKILHEFTATSKDIELALGKLESEA